MGLLNLIRKEKDLRKLFGERELKIIEKQLLGVNLTLSERTRLSRDIRQKFRVIDKLFQFSSEFDLKKGAEIKKLIGEAKDVILRSKYFSRIKKIILFGSTVENQRTLRSDIDLAVVFDKITEKEAVRFRLDVFFNEKLDIQVYNVLPEKIKKEINLKGKAIYERKNKELTSNE